MNDNCTDAEGYCLTCSDAAFPARILTIDPSGALAQVAVQDRTEEVDISLVENVAPGDMILIHGGVAVAFLASAT